MSMFNLYINIKQLNFRRFFFLQIMSLMIIIFILKRVHCNYFLPSKDNYYVMTSIKDFLVFIVNSNF